MNKTSEQFETIINVCKDIFVKKMKDYGSAWRVLRAPSLTDQIFIKAQRIRSIEEKGTQKIQEDIRSEYIGIVNYCVIALIQIELGISNDSDNLDLHVATQLYEKYIYKAKSLMEDKNHDYGEAWRDMRIGSLTDIILMKLLRTKQIEDNNGKTNISEGVDANYYDMINYSVFALIKIMESEVK
jgi:hypothetical protein